MVSVADPAARRPDRYETLGRSYRQTRREDPRIAARIRAALGDARSVLNVGAGAGSYEPPGLRVVAAEPAAVMIRQRPDGAAPALRAVAEALPLRDGSLDAAMALLTVHHWRDPLRGLAELRRVASRIVILLSSTLTSRMWLTSEYFPAMARQRRPDIQPGVIAGWLARPEADHLGNGSRWRVRIEPLPLPRDCLDGFGEAFWARPEAYLDPVVRAGMSAFGLLTEAERRPGIDRLEADLASGAWQARHARLRELDELDCGHRLVVAEREAPDS
jgi:SAM-dependent methyltransferase